MCGIIAVLSRPSARDLPGESELLSLAGRAIDLLLDRGVVLSDRLEGASEVVTRLDRLLRGPVGVEAVLTVEGLGDRLEDVAAQLEGLVAVVERELDEALLPAHELEPVNRALLALKDAIWAVARDRLRTTRAVEALAGGARTSAALRAYHDVQVALSALDRLEVRGRDSAGLHLLVHGHAVDESRLAAALQERADPLFRSGSLRQIGDCLAFVYKAAAEIGKLGDNTRALRGAIAHDALLREVLTSGPVEVAVLGHTRWASVGLISEANAHPLNQEHEGTEQYPYVAAALNGDVDNHTELIASEGLCIPAEVTTDAKVIPVLVGKRCAGGASFEDAFSTSVTTFVGSVAIAAQSAEEPGRMSLACRGSGQGLFVGLTEDAFVVASEPYGLVEVADRYLRLEGEAVEHGATTAGQVVVLDRSAAGSPEGMTRFDYAGTPLPVTERDLRAAEVTTRDIDLGDEPHFLLKEIAQSPDSIQKTLRGKIEQDRGRLRVALGETTLPASLRSRLAAGAVPRILVIGQGTAAVAGQAMVHAVSRASRTGRLTAQAVVATELSGYGLRDDMSDTLVVAVSQSGTTTDTNRTVDLVRARGAAVIAIVNRRNSDLVEKADGVLYTADGRDVEMSVASTKAFYSQVAAGILLAVAVTEAAGDLDTIWSHEVLAGLRALPSAMAEVLGNRKRIADAAGRHAPARRNWAIAGNGPNTITARELRIKLSELCYRSIAVDHTEDKKHIDLSAEPMVLVCAAGLPAAVAGDVAKEVAIYRAHRAAPVVIASEGTAFEQAADLIEVPRVHPDLDYVLATMAGHLFGYEAALTVDAQARLLRTVRDAVQSALVAERAGADVLAALRDQIRRPSGPVLTELASSRMNGHLEASTAIRVSALIHHALDERGLEGYSAQTGRPEAPSALVEDLLTALTTGIDELTRPVDAIKHQAKTVTVGTSRTEDDLYHGRLAASVLGAGVPRERVSFRALRSLAALEPAFVSVDGYTRYVITGDVATGAALRVMAKDGVARRLASRTETDPRLRGTKHRAAHEREVTVARGHDGRLVVLVPETVGGDAVGLTLLHVTPAQRLEPRVVREVLAGHRNRYAAIVDAVTETQRAFDDHLLGSLDPAELLTQPVAVLAEHWHSPPAGS